MGGSKHKYLDMIHSNKFIILVSLVFVVLYTFNLDKFPSVYIDENLFSNPAYMLITNGTFGTTLMYGFLDLQNYTYWQPPMYIILLAISFKTFGLGVLQSRIVSVLLGFTSMIFTYMLGKELYNENVGVIAAALLTFNFLFFYVARQARMDIAVVCFTIIAVFLIVLALKKSNLTYYFLSGIFAMLALLSHPNGLLAILTIYVMIFIYKISTSNKIIDGILLFFKEKGLYLYSLALILTSIPYLIYISLAFTLFKAQIMFNFLNSVFMPITNIIEEPYRYAASISFIQTAYGINSLLIAFFVVMLILIITVVAVLTLLKPKNYKIENRLILSAFLTPIILFAVLNAHKVPIYLSILIPFWSIIIAASINQINFKKLKPKLKISTLAFSAVAIIIIINAALIGNALYITHSYNYYTVESEISNYIPSNSTVLGDGDYYMALEGRYNYYSQANVVWFNDDTSFSQINPNYLLFNPNYEEENLTPETQNYINQNYQQIAIIPQNKNIEGSPITIYKKNS